MKDVFLYNLSWLQWQKPVGVFLFKPQVIFKKVMTFEVEVIYGSEIEITASQKKAFLTFSKSYLSLQ